MLGQLSTKSLFVGLTQHSKGNCFLLSTHHLPSCNPMAKTELLVCYYNKNLSIITDCPLSRAQPARVRTMPVLFTAGSPRVGPASVSVC